MDKIRLPTEPPLGARSTGCENRRAMLLRLNFTTQGTAFPECVFFAIVFGAMLEGLQAQPPAVSTSSPLPTLEEALASRSDLWGEAALRQPDGPSDEFFEKLLPPPRYVNADFKYYPIVLSAPNNKVKARLISNGSGINLRAGSRSWHDTGTPVTFRVGPDEFLFGGLRDRLSEPTLAEGFLPIVEIRYRHGSPVQSEGLVPVDQKKLERPPEIYRLESFVSTDSALAEHGMVFTSFSL